MLAQTQNSEQKESRMRFAHIIIRITLDNVPKVLQSATELQGSQRTIERGEYSADLATGHARTERIVANTDLFVNESIRKIVLAPSHSANKDGNIMALRQCGQVVGEPDSRRVTGQGYERINMWYEELEVDAY